MKNAGRRHSVVAWTGTIYLFSVAVNTILCLSVTVFAAARAYLDTLWLTRATTPKNTFLWLQQCAGTSLTHRENSLPTTNQQLMVTDPSEIQLDQNVDCAPRFLTFANFQFRVYAQHCKTSRYELWNFTVLNVGMTTPLEKNPFFFQLRLKGRWRFK